MIRVQKKLRDQVIFASEKRIARLMKEFGLFVSKPKYQAEHKKPIPNPYFRNRLDQQYDQTAPNLVWVSDITYVKVGEKYYYVCVVLDLFSRMVLSYLLFLNEIDRPTFFFTATKGHSTHLSFSGRSCEI